MYTRHDVRYNCFRMKRGNPPRDPDIIAEIEKQLGDYKWTEFTEKWDVAVDNTGNIIVISSLRDINKALEVCTYAHIASKQNADFISDMNLYDRAIVHSIEAQFLTGIMTWQNYRENWSIAWNDERSRIETYLLKLPQTQKPVTEEMINEKLAESVKASDELFNSVAKGNS